jgi:hypothetical protein
MGSGRFSAGMPKKGLETACHFEIGAENPQKSENQVKNGQKMEIQPENSRLDRMATKNT